MDCDHTDVDVSSKPVSGLKTITTRHVLTCTVCGLSTAVIVDDVIAR